MFMPLGQKAIFIFEGMDFLDTFFNKIISFFFLVFPIMLLSTIVPFPLLHTKYF